MKKLILVAIGAILSVTLASVNFSIPLYYTKLYLKKDKAHKDSIELVEHSKIEEVGLTKSNDLDTSVFLFEIFNKRTNERVFYIDLWSLDKDMRSKGWERTMPENASDVCENIKDEIVCNLTYKHGEKIIHFDKVLPRSDYYFNITFFYRGTL